MNIYTVLCEYRVKPLCNKIVGKIDSSILVFQLDVVLYFSENLTPYNQQLENVGSLKELG